MKHEKANAKINDNGSTRTSTPIENLKRECVGVGKVKNYTQWGIDQGITLIALVITIIILLILAGIVISLTLGENGVINKAKESGIAYEEAQAREKLELVLFDLQADKETDEAYSENESINAKISQNGMAIDGDIVLIDGWRFTIDRSVPKIKESLGKGELKAVSITTPYVGTASFTTKNVYVYNEEEIESYTYKIDGVETKTIPQKEYTTENELEPESTHTVQVIAKYKDGTQLESNTVTIKTEPRTYLYHNGDQCTDITGGWEAVDLGCGNGVLVMAPNLDTSANYMYASIWLASTSYQSMTGGSIKPKAYIDYSKYKKFCIKYTASMTHSNSASVVDVWYYNNEGMYGLLDRLAYSSVSSMTTRKVNISQIKDANSIYIYLQNQYNARNSTVCSIYEVWLEK